MEDLIAYLSGSEGVQQEEEQEGLEDTEKEETSVKEPEWDEVKLPKAFRREQMLVLWQGCFYCERL